VSFAHSLARVASSVNAHLDLVFDGFLARQGDAAQIVAAMRYACARGKRLRAFLVMESARLHGVAEAQSLWPAAGVEAIHAYSLVHDDLPCMDDDDLRRGVPTVHRVWDETTAVLTGDALQALGFELVCHSQCSPLGDVRATLAHTLAQAAGAMGMIRGQALDMAAQAQPAVPNEAQIAAIQAGKTGALIAWAAQCGARMAQADSTALGLYARALGRAFQIRDDILNQEGDALRLGKAVGSDAVAGKATLVAALGMESAKSRARALVQEAQDALSGYGAAAETLRAAARFAITRES